MRKRLLVMFMVCFLVTAAYLSWVMVAAGHSGRTVVGPSALTPAQ